MLALGVGLSLLTGSLPAIAAPAGEDETIDTEARAMKAYREGQEAYDAGNYAEALDLFLEAQSLYPSPDFHYNIGRCHEALESYEQAVVSYKAYLRSYNSAYGEDPADKVNIQNKIDRLAKQIEADEAAAEAERNKEPEVIIKTVPGEDKPKGPPGRPLIITGGVLAGVGLGVAVAGGAVFGARAASASDELEAVYSGNAERVTLDEARDIDQRGRAAELNQILMLSIGSAVAVTGVALLVVGVLKNKKGPTVAPAIGPEGAGLVIRGRF
ncbi:MAG: hypothetical protein R6X02_27670 [Enhygromyxa sp.]